MSPLASQSHVGLAQPGSRPASPPRRWPTAEGDLRWYFAHRDPEQPLRSSFMPGIQRLKGVRGRGIDRPSPPDQLLIDARRRHRIERVVVALPSESVGLLEAAFDPDLPRELAPLAPIGGLIAASSLATEAHRESGSVLGLHAWLKQQSKDVGRSSAARDLVRTLRADAWCKWDHAIEAFVEMRRKVGR
jgi:hypothetical protein